MAYGKKIKAWQINKIFSNVLDFIKEVCDFRVTAKTHRLYMANIV